MPKKKTNYENKGFVRRIAGSIFASSRGDDAPANHGIANNGIPMNVGEPKWRPRKKQFERLDGDDGDDDDLAIDDNVDNNLKKRTDGHYQKWTIHNVFSTESEAGDYKREIFYDRKRATMKHHVGGSNKKRDLSAFSIKPPTKDTLAIRSTKSNLSFTKRQKGDKSNSTTSMLVANESADISSVDAFGFRPQNSFSSVLQDDASTSRHTMSSRNTTASSKHSNPDPSNHTVSSDPTDFYSKETVQLTKNNLARMAAMSASTKEKLDSQEDTWCRNARQGKFYQFAIDEDKESTVVESNVGLSLGFGIKGGGHKDDNSVMSYDDDMYSDEDEYSAGVVSQKTKVQERIIACVPKPANETSIKNNDVFFGDSEHSERNTSCDGEDFDAFGVSKKETRQNFIAFPEISEPSIHKLTPDDPFLKPRRNLSVPPPPSRPASIHSLSYSPSPKNRKALQQKADSVAKLTRDERLPLSPLNNVKASGSGSSRNMGLPPNNPRSSSFKKKTDLGSEWTAFHDQRPQTSKSDADSIFDAFGIVCNKYLKTQKPKQQASLATPFNALVADFAEQGHTKENKISLSNNHSGAEGKLHGIRNIQSHMGFSSASESDSDEDGDTFDENGLWERSGGRSGLGTNRFSSEGSIGGVSVTPQGSHYIEVDDSSFASNGNASATGSFNKPMGLPNNAIMASMLFRTHYNIDQHVVEKKIKAKEEEHTKNKKARCGDIPDAIHADFDYMTNVSSFSEETYQMQEAWRKPSRDLLDYFSKARTMQVNTQERLESQRAKAKSALFEA